MEGKRSFVVKKAVFPGAVAAVFAKIWGALRIEKIAGRASFPGVFSRKHGTNAYLCNR